MTSKEIREKYLKFFEAKGHMIVPSASLIPEGDSTTLFTGSGMQPMVPYLLGQKHPLGTRIADSQKSFRAEDIEEVGDNRHTTFFEMLGNWSLGDYWKEEQLNWIFQFLVDEVGLKPEKLYVSVFYGNDKYGMPKDKESADIWKKLFKSKNITAEEADLVSEENASKLGIKPSQRIFYYQDKNWWSRTGLPENMPAGEPGGPDSEIFYEFTDVEHNPKFGANCHPNCNCGRFLEIGNNVFMQYQKQEDGSFKDLPQKNVDFGGGLERITAASNNNQNVFTIDTLQDIIGAVRALPRFEVYEGDHRAEQIIADHIRASVFLISDGVIPSNTQGGYVLRRLIRRSSVYGKQIKLPDHFQGKIAQKVIEIYQNSFPELSRNREVIMEELVKEESKFSKMLERGLSQFKKTIGPLLVAWENEKPKTTRDRFIPAEIVFNLYETYGFPIELTREIAKKQYQTDLDKQERIDEEFKKHQDLSRTASAGMFKGGLASNSDKVVRLHTATHLMNAALRKVLGNNVWQKGSNITEERTRFDFQHDKKMTDEEKAAVEKLVNEWISRDLSMKRETMSLDEARKLNAIGVFGEKYPDTVSVYTVFDPKTEEVISREFCGGPHVEHTGMIGKFKIQKEEAVSAGVRRIKAIVE